MNLEAKLKALFPNTEIVKLEDITTKIAGISKVRVGKDRTYTDYDEISLNDINEYGMVYIPKNPKEVGPANYTAIRSQILQPGDIVMTQRGKVGKVGLIGNNYKRAIVGNNSMIRIQFPHNRNNETSQFVQAYLQLPYVREYLNNQITCGSVDRKILSAATLSNLPIPMFKEGDGQFTEFLYTRKELSIEAARIEKELQELIELYAKIKDDCVALGINKYDELQAINIKDKGVLSKLSGLREDLGKIKARHS
jgi:hypothetical protein